MEGQPSTDPANRTHRPKIYGVWCLTWPSAMSTSARRPASTAVRKAFRKAGLPDRRLHEENFTH